MNILDEERSEVKVRKKRKPNSWEEGWTELENRIWTQGFYLSDDARLVYWVLKSFYNADTRLCYPAIPTIVDRSRLTRTRVINALAELEEFCWIEKKKRFGGSTYYTFHTPRRSMTNEAGEQKIAPDQTCPSYKESVEWEIKHKRRGRSWKHTVKAAVQVIENEEKNEQFDAAEIPF